MTTTATIKVQFGNPAAAAAVNAHLSATIDSRPAGLNVGKTTFLPGETAYILIYKSSNVVITATDTSAGSLSLGGAILVEQSEEVQFADATSGSLNVAAMGGITSYTWMGRDLGSPVLSSDATTITVPTKGVGILKVNYFAEAIVCSLVSPLTVNGFTDFSILALITGEVA